jgi:hypothetical protein
MFSVITDIYNKKTKGPTLMELFTATGRNACNHGEHYETPCIMLVKLYYLNYCGEREPNVGQPSFALKLEACILLTVRWDYLQRSCNEEPREKNVYFEVAASYEVTVTKYVAETLTN